MRRYEAIREIMRAVSNEPVVCNLGHPTQELYALHDRSLNFYMLGSMGLASSIAHGMALCLDRKVIAIDGDASVTMNLGGLATIGHTRPRNLVEIIIDNRANGSTGFQPSFTADRLRLDEVARAAGIELVSVVNRESDIVSVVQAALASPQGPHLILIRTEIGMPAGIDILPIGPAEIRKRFMEGLHQ